jgi:ankyrin repeat protein
MTAKPLLVLLVLVVTLAAGQSCTANAKAGPLSGAAARGDLDAVTRLLAAGLDPDTADGPRRSRPLSAAARRSQLAVLDVLIRAGAHVNLRDAGGNGWVPLIHAVHTHQPAAVRFLLERGATPDGPSDLTMTPLMMAVASGQTDTARLLIERGANVRRQSPGGASMLALAISGGALTDIDKPLFGGCHPDMVRLVLQHAPELGLRQSVWDRGARVFAGFNGCRASLELVRR